MSEPDGIKRNSQGVPIWDGDEKSFPEYKAATREYEAGTQWEKRYLVGPRCAAELKGTALALWRSSGRSANYLSVQNGLTLLLAILERKGARPTLPDLSDLLVTYFRRMKKEERPEDVRVLGSQVSSLLAGTERLAEIARRTRPEAS